MRKFGDHGHSLAATAGRGLDEQGKANTRSGLDEVGVRHGHGSRAGSDWHTERNDVGFGADLVAHHLNGAGARADKHDTGVGAGPGKLHILREESVAGVHCLRSRLPSGSDERRRVEIGVDQQRCLGEGDVS